MNFENKIQDTSCFRDKMSIQVKWNRVKYILNTIKSPCMKGYKMNLLKDSFLMCKTLYYIQTLHKELWGTLHKILPDKQLDELNGILTESLRFDQKGKWYPYDQNPI